MANAVFGFQNAVKTAALTSLGTAAPGLDVSQLQNDQGSPSTALQTAGTTATVLIDTGADASTWRAFLLARTNLTTSATVRWRVGSADALIEAPLTLSANFNPGIPAGWTYSRASVATLANAAGGLTPYAANSPRIEARGVLIEGAATNLFGYNDQATANQYSNGGNTVTAQGGSNYPGAVTTQCTVGGTDPVVYYIPQNGLTAGAYYTASCWVYVPGSATLTALTMQWEGNVSNTVTATVNLAIRDQFQLIACAVLVSATSSNVVMRIVGAPVGTVIYVCSKQIEAGQSPTSYIHTAGGNTASRAADVLYTTAGVAAACASGSYTLATLAYWVGAPSPAGTLDGSLAKSGVGFTAMARFGTTAFGLAFNGSGTQSAAFSQSYTVGYSRIVVAISPGGLGVASFGNAAQSTSGLAVAQLPDTLGFAAVGGASMFVNGFGLYPTRLSDAQITSLATTGATATGAVAYDSGKVSAGVQPGFGQSVVIAPAEVTGRVCVLDVSNPSNSDGFLNIPLAYAGPVWTPATNIDYQTTFGRDDQVDEVTSRGGAEFPSVQWTRRRWDVSLQGIRASEVWTQAMALDLAARAGGNVLFVPDPAGANIARETVFGRLKSLADLSFPFGNADRRAWRARITERL